MKMPRRSLLIASMCTVSAVLASCGGGGGSALAGSRNEAGSPAQALWTLDQPVDLATGQILSQQLLLADTAPFVMALWSARGSVPTGQIQVAVRRVSDAAWSPPVRLDDGQGNVGLMKAVVDGTTGRGAVVWLATPNGLLHTVFVSRIDLNSGTLGPPIPIASSFNILSSPDVGIDGQGSITALWLESAAGVPNFVRLASLSTDGTHIFRTAPLINNAGPAHQSNPTLHVSRTGVVRAAWRQEPAALSGNTTPVQIVSAIFQPDFINSSLLPRDEIVVRSEGTTRLHEHILTADPLGNAAVLTRETTTAGGAGITVRNVGANGVWGNFTVVPGAGSIANAPAVQDLFKADMGGDGTLAVSWETVDARIQSNVRPAGGSFFSEAHVVQGIGFERHGGVRIRVKDDGGALMLWRAARPGAQPLTYFGQFGSPGAPSSWTVPVLHQDDSTEAVRSELATAAGHRAVSLVQLGDSGSAQRLVARQYRE